MTLALGFLVKQPGVLSLIQDAGRFGACHLGVSNGGPIDCEAFHWANRLCGNELGVSSIEVSIGGLILFAQIDTIIAITGANMPLTINGQAKPLWRSYHVNAGDCIKLGYASEGVRCYIAVYGGFTVPPVFGSSATVCRENIGGLSGGKLAVGDIIPYEKKLEVSDIKTLKLPEEYWPNYTRDLILRTIASYQQQLFSSQQQRLFFSTEFTVSKNCDRMGYRLEGPRISSDVDGILSEGICQGAIQIPTDGQPIVLMNDRQTIGGYPKIGSVISLDTSKLGQLSQGAKVRFESVSMERANDIYHFALNSFKCTNLITCDKP
ncbi:MAG: biotin-dependent carboxyltransferase family protein [Litorilituus sp.]|jgi:biotin-dependent carboxylase-like uncharacterized protein|nr:biotin-dependent carboxyltransferase family protein [Litorilituus sp.]